MIEYRVAQPETKSLRSRVVGAEVFIHVEGSYARPVDSLFLPERWEHFMLAWCCREDHAHALLPLKAPADFVRYITCRPRASRLGIQIYEYRFRSAVLCPECSHQSLKRLPLVGPSQASKYKGRTGLDSRIAGRQCFILFSPHREVDGNAPGG